MLHAVDARIAAPALVQDTDCNDSTRWSRGWIFYWTVFNTKLA
jgi:hypothetical protein